MFVKNEELKSIVDFSEIEDENPGITPENPSEEQDQVDASELDEFPASLTDAAEVITPTEYMTKPTQKVK